MDSSYIVEVDSCERVAMADSSHPADECSAEDVESGYHPQKFLDSLGEVDGGVPSVYCGNAIPYSMDCMDPSLYWQLMLNHPAMGVNAAYPWYAYGAWGGAQQGENLNYPLWPGGAADTISPGQKSSKRSRRGGRKQNKKEKKDLAGEDSAAESTGTGRETDPEGDEEKPEMVPPNIASDVELETKLNRLTVDELESDKGLCTFLEERVDKSPQARKLIVKWLLEASEDDASIARTITCAQKKNACRVVQAAVLAAKGDETQKFLKLITDKFDVLVADDHGNHCVQKVVEVIPAEGLTLLINCFKGKEEALAKKRFGCRVWERIIEHCQQPIWPLIDELLKDDKAEALSRNQFSNFVISSLLEHQPDYHKLILDSMVNAPLGALVMHRTASHVVQKALQKSDATWQKKLVQALVQDEEALVNIAGHKYGSYVLEELTGLQKQNGDDSEVRQELVKVRHILLKNQERLLNVVRDFPSCQTPSNNIKGAANANKGGANAGPVERVKRCLTELPAC